MKYLVVALIVLAVIVVIVVVLLKGNKVTTLPPSGEYVRVEDDATKVFYKSYADYMTELPDDINKFVEQIQAETSLPRQSDVYPVDPHSIQSAASAFVKAVRDVYSFELSLESDDATQLDRFANRYLVDPAFRHFFPDEGPRNLSEKEENEYYKAIEKIKVPNEPLLYYAMGSFWGEWLVRHRGCIWRLYKPLHPIQSFPDIAGMSHTMCFLPFSQVVKKLSDPAGDNLAFKSKAMTMERFFKPFPLIASLGDVEYAASSVLPALAKEAIAKEEANDLAAAVSLYRKAIEAEPDNVKLYSMGIGAAWRAQMWDEVQRWSEEAVRLAPDNPVLNHNLAVFYSHTEGGIPKAIEYLEKVLKKNPNYGRAHITIASCYLDTGRKDEAIQHLNWVKKHDDQLAKEADQLLKEINAKRAR